MENKIGKPNTKVNAKNKSVRISLENQKKAEKILALANKKKLGRKIKIDHVLAIALDLVTDEHIRKMQDQSLSNEDRKEQLRQKYIEARGPISRDEFTGFMLTREFSEFLAQQSQIASAA
jgi:hypothetical protein